jgi:hypothetical protein
VGDIKDYIDLFAALAAATSAFFSYLALRSFNSQTYATILVSCMENYMQVEKGRSEAIRKNSVDLCKEYYHLLFDLTWREFKLWKMGCIPNPVMISWLLGRRKQYKNEKISIKKKDGEILVEYKGVWEDRIKDGYFDSESDFGKFMNDVHQGNRRIGDILKDYANQAEA